MAITNNNSSIIWNFLKAQGLNDFGIAGLMGNLYAESGLKPTNLQNTFEKKLGMSDDEYTKAVDDKTYTNFVKDSAGYGLAQWTYYSRKQKMLDFHTEKGKSIGDLTTQLEFLVQELTTGYKTSVWEVLKTAKSVLEASNAVLLKFERPADQSEAVQTKRASYGQEYYDAYATKNNIQGGKETMKYSASNKPLVCMQTQSTCYKGTKKMTVKGVLWHSTAANNPTLKRYIQPSDKKPAEDTYSKTKWLEILGKNKHNNDMNHIERKMGMNAWIGELADGTVTSVQSMPWDYRPWGCASGKNGSCNSGWIQFEICEDDLKDKAYFDKIYKEACELTAYLCKMYNLDPKGTKKVGNVKVPVIICHQDSYQLGLGNNHADIYHWFKKYGKDMNTVRNDVAKFMNSTVATPSTKPSTTKPANTETTTLEAKYVIRKSWIEKNTQIGAYANLENAKKARDKAGNNYEVYDIKTGTLVYPVASGTEDFHVGDTVRLLPGAKWSNGDKIPDWFMKKTIYVRGINSNGTIVVSSLKTGAISGSIKPQYLEVLTSKTEVVKTPSSTPNFKSYLVIVITDALNVRNGAGTQYKVNTTIKKGQVFTIIDEKEGWGKIKSGAGWINLSYTQKL